MLDLSIMSLSPPPPLPPRRRFGRWRKQVAILATLAVFECWLGVRQQAATPRILHQPDGGAEEPTHRRIHDDPSPTNDAKNLWDDSPTIPPWMKRYFEWHREERARLTRENWRSQRYLVLRCLKTDKYCGGASDRLKPIPYLIMVANRTNRLFFITWSRPAPLEEFLIPPQGGVNWTIPNEAVDFGPHLVGRKALGGPRRNDTGIIWSEKNSHWANTGLLVVEARLNTAGAGVAYDEGRDSLGEVEFDRVFGDVWRVFFEPTPPLAARIASTQARLNLTAGRYVSVHVRAQYVKNLTERLYPVQNALHCATTLLPSAPIYVASDSAAVSRYALEYGRSVLNRSVVANLQETEPLHIDRGKDFISKLNYDWDQYPPSAFYDTFVDLYLLGAGRCSAFGIGGYGHWASLLSRDARCAVRHTEQNCAPPPSPPLT